MPDQTAGPTPFKIIRVEDISPQRMKFILNGLGHLYVCPTMESAEFVTGGAVFVSFVWRRKKIIRFEFDSNLSHPMHDLIHLQLWE